MACHRAASCPSQDSSSSVSGFSSLRFPTTPHYHLTCKNTQIFPLLHSFSSAPSQTEEMILIFVQEGLEGGPPISPSECRGLLKWKSTGTGGQLCACFAGGSGWICTPCWSWLVFLRIELRSILQGLQRVPCAIKLSLETSIEKSRRKLSINAFTLKHHTWEKHLQTQTLFCNH